jgi:inhibitor of KinA
MAGEIFFYPLGDTAIVVQMGNEINETTHYKINAFVQLLEKYPFKGIMEVVPAYTTVTVYYNLYEVAGSRFFKTGSSVYDYVKSFLQEMSTNLNYSVNTPSVLITIPVCYGKEFGPDLEDVANLNSLDTDEVIKIHSNAEYLVFIIGFAPGFPYLGGMSSRIATPRKESPRLKIPAGSVGIAEKQTGIYPIETPGGWQIIGRTPLRLFRPEQEGQPSLLKPGNHLRFQPISKEEFNDFTEFFNEDKSN